MINQLQLGINTLIRFNEERAGFSWLHAHLIECVKKTPTQEVLVHKECRRDFTIEGGHHVVMCQKMTSCLQQKS